MTGTALYFTALVLPPELNQKVLHWKQYLFEKYGCKVGLKSPAHITILPPFWMAATLENDLIMATDEIGSATLSFEITTNNYSAFKPRTLFIDVAPDVVLSNLKTTSDDYFKQHKQFVAKIDARPFHPHITLATRDLHKKAFYEAWSFFEPKEFIETWKATGLSLLKHNTKTWHVIHTSPFKQETTIEKA